MVSSCLYNLLWEDQCIISDEWLVFSRYSTNTGLSLKIPPEKYHLVVLVSLTNKQMKLIIYIDVLRMTVELFLRLFFHGHQLIS